VTPGASHGPTARAPARPAAPGVGRSPTGNTDR
jgi:hypothetical protein